MTTIAPYQRKARALGLTVKKASRRKHKKLDVYKDGVYQASIGQTPYKDYQMYLRSEGKEVAEAKRRAYRARHVHRTTKYRDNKLTAAWLASAILW